MQHCAFPAGVHGSHNAFDGVVKQYGDAVGRPYADGNAGHVRHECVVAFQILSRQIRSVHDGNLAVMYLMPLNDRIG